MFCFKWMNLLLFLSLNLPKLVFVNHQIRITSDWNIDEGVIHRTLPKHDLSFRSISVLLALELLPKHNSRSFLNKFPIFSELLSSDLLVKVLFAFTDHLESEGYESLGRKVHFTTCYLWFVERDHQHICHFLIFAFLLFRLCAHSLSFSLDLLTVFSHFVPQSVYFIFFIPASLPQGTHSESYVMCIFLFSFTERYSIYQFATKAWGEITWKKWIICFLWMLYTLKKSDFLFTAVDD